MARVLVLLTLLTNGRAAAEPPAAAEATSAFRRGARAARARRAGDRKQREKPTSVCANGLADRSNPQRYAPHRDSLALRVSDFEDQTSQGLELVAPSPEYDSGKRNVASCFGGLAAYAQDIFRTCDYAPPSNDPEGWDCEHVLLAKCMATNGWRQWLLEKFSVMSKT